MSTRCADSRGEQSGRASRERLARLLTLDGHPEGLAIGLRIQRLRRPELLLEVSQHKRREVRSCYLIATTSPPATTKAAPARKLEHPVRPDFKPVPTAERKET